jgi:hypothetical protein
MKAPRRLTAPLAEGPLEPGEPSQERRRLPQSGQDLERSQGEDEPEVGELLERVERQPGVVRVGWLRLRLLQLQVSHERPPRIRDDLPRGRHQPPPLRREKQESDVEETAEEPEECVQEVPVAAQAEAVSAGERQPGGPGGLLVRGAPQPVFGHLLAGESQPFAPRLAVDVPVEFRMRRQDGQAAPGEEHHKEERLKTDSGVMRPVER